MSNPRPVTLSTKPTYSQLVNLNGLKIVEHITSHRHAQCVDFAYVLLNDDNLVRKFENRARDDDDFVHQVLRKWVSRDTSTLGQLEQCVKDAGLDGTLAKSIRDACTSEPGPSGVLPPVTSSSASYMSLPADGAAYLPPVTPVQTSSAAHPCADVKQPPIDRVFGHSVTPYDLKKSIVDAPDPAAYWKLNDKSIRKYTGKGTTLLMFDTGIKESLRSFASKNLLQFNFPCDDEDGHGTLCSGIACGNPIEGKFDGKTVKCRGVAPGAQLVIWKAYKEAKDDIDVEPWVEELEQLADNCDGVDVVVISSGTKSPKPRMERAIKALDQNGIIMICSASNSGGIDKDNVTYPARYQATISVGAHNRLGNRCDFSSVGKELDCLALGEDVIGPNLSNSLTQVSGTSFAAPAVGGLICLILEAIHEICTKENNLEVYHQMKNNRVMKQLLMELTTARGENNCISPKNLSDFFANPKHFIERLRMNGTI